MEFTMKINVKCYASLAEGSSCNHHDISRHELVAGKTIDDLIKNLQLSRNKVEFAFLNGKKVDLNTVLTDGDHVGLFPAVGGM
jgi:molybdopterin converting factor small subunit